MVTQHARKLRTLTPADTQAVGEVLEEIAEWLVDVGLGVDWIPRKRVPVLLRLPLAKAWMLRKGGIIVTWLNHLDRVLRWTGGTEDAA